MTNDWRSWCRLCARENGNEIDVFIKNENVTSIADAIRSFFSISIHDTDAISTKICNVCYDIVIELINFTIRSSRVQELFNELQFHQNFEILDLNELRLKYGLSQEIREIKCLKDNHSIEKQEIIKIDGIQDDNFLDENIDRFFKCDKGNFDVQNDVGGCDLNSNVSEDEKPFFNFKTEKGLVLKSIGVKQKKNINVFHQDIIESNLSEKETEFDSDRSLDNKNVENKYLFENKSSPSKTKIINKNFTIKQCGICCKNFNSITKYNYHIKSKHKMDKKIEPVMCKTCGKSFKKLSKLQEHENLHLPPEKRKWYSCPQCDKKFAVQTSIQLHIRAVHVREKTFICEECGKAFVTSDQLNSHKVVHSDFTPFQCPKCPKSFKRLPSLKNHIDSHEDTKYICPICGCQLNTKTILRRHMVIHSDEKKYKCNFCQKEFKRTKALKNHLILHTGLKPYECPFCDQTFANGSNCRKHQKNSHPSELAAMEESGEKKACKNVPRLEHLKAVNNAAINSSNGINSKIENSSMRNVNMFSNTDGVNKIIHRSSFETESQNPLPLIPICENINFPIFSKIEIKEKGVIVSKEIPSDFHN